MNTTDDNDNSMSCANCGKEGNNLNNTCNKCKLVKYCNAACKKKHRSKHKKKCDRRVAELHDQALFKQPPKREDCPICFMRMPSLETGFKFYACCGKIICSGCILANKMTSGKNMCPFCRSLAPKTDEEIMKMLKKRAEIDDAESIYNLACDYAGGRHGLPEDRDKALELWHRAGRLGHARSFHMIGCAYSNGRGVERDEKKAIHYWEPAAMGGVVGARHNLGNAEGRAGNIDRALKHFMIAAGSGKDGSLKIIKQLYFYGHATRDDYAKALQAYQAYLDEIKSDDRDKAAAFSDTLKYYG